MLPSSPPLRTAREAFASSSSSLSNALFRTRLHIDFSLAVKLLVACGMEQHPIVHLISVAFGSPHFVVVMPSCQSGNPLVAERTKPLLAFPEGKQLPFSPEAAFHFHAETLLEVHLPCGVEGVRFPLNFDMPFNRRLCCPEEPDGFNHSIFSDHFL